LFTNLSFEITSGEMKMSDNNTPPDAPPDKPWHGKRYAFFSHSGCEAFPCHPTGDAANFNCLFCYCPLYMLGSECGGSPAYSPDGIKDCTNCTLPHERENYGIIVGRFQDIVDKMKIL
jgi:Zn-finger protein